MKKRISLLVLPLLAMTLTSCGASADAFMKAWGKNNEAEVPAYKNVEITTNRTKYKVECDNSLAKVILEGTLTAILGGNKIEKKTDKLPFLLATYVLTEIEAKTYKPESEEEEGVKMTETLSVFGSTLSVTIKVVSNTEDGKGTSTAKKSWGKYNLITKHSINYKASGKIEGADAKIEGAVTYSYKYIA